MKRSKSSKLIIFLVTYLNHAFLSSATFIYFQISHYKWLSFGLFAIFFVGILAPFISPNGIVLGLLQAAIDKFSSQNLSPIDMIGYIFSNNLTILLTNLIFGFIVIYPIGMIFFNGFLVGVMVDYILRLSAVSHINLIPNILVALLPHGIIEIPTFIISAFLSILLVIKLLAPKNIQKNLSKKHFFLQIIKAHVFVIIPCLFLAAVIESTITPVLVTSTMNILIVKPHISDLSLRHLFITTSAFSLIGVSAKQIPVKLGFLDNTLISEHEIATYLFDPTLYTLMKQVTILGSEKESYQLTDHALISITIQKYKNEANANKEVQVNKRMFQIFGQDNKSYTLSQYNNYIYQATSKQKKFYLSFGAIKNVTYNISYTGKNAKLFATVVLLQMQKIMNQLVDAK